MAEEVKAFVKAYNKRREWDKEILDSMKGYIISKTAKEFIEPYISSHKITKRGYEMDSAKVYSYDNGTLELQAFCLKTCGTRYFWVKPDEPKEDYKKRMIGAVREEVAKRISELSAEIEVRSKEKCGLELINAGISRV